MKAQSLNRSCFSKLPALKKAALIKNFAGKLVETPGLHQVNRYLRDCFLKEHAAVSAHLLKKGVKNILVSVGAKDFNAEIQLTVFLRGEKYTFANKPLWFNVPASLMGNGGVLLFNQGIVEQETTADSKYAKITLQEVKAGLTDFGEEMVNFMELNRIELLEILTDLTIPRYQKLGFAGAVYGDKLGMKGDVSRWNTVQIRIKDNCLGCFNCVLVCPAGAIKLAQNILTPLTEAAKIWREKEVKTFHPNRVTIQSDACKGCQLCVGTCKADAIEAIEALNRNE
ncbi:4Fe-4S dicluster domain-containing protein [Candidatus Saganbacteria bacterium]|uniref:4Fe-4S dicluster domain-containing protein n=1 Tax=Candidatus Saganbacteria bacterium TaxID=2575572 RepID=A0A9D6YVG4_UNCSA|nr:4Fe-4S dicluster domain-containing protein [Candidatus Saganbacteria bacterium]